MLAANPPGEDDRQLVRKYKESGDLEVLGLLFSRYTPLIYGVCLKYLKDRDEARDAVMQIFEKLINSLKQHPVENFKSWLYVLSRNHCLMYLRSQKGKITRELSPELMESDLILHPEEEPELEQNLGQLEKCINELTDHQKRCVQLFFLEEKCYQQIVVVTGFDLNKVKSHIQNGKRNLKLCMDRNG